MSGAPLPPTARPLGGLFGSTTNVLWARACGCGSPTLSPWPACPVGAACREGGGGPSPGGVACRCCEGRLVSGAVSPPAAHPLGRAGGVPQPVCPGCGRGDRATVPQLVPLRAGVARCGGGGRASPGGLPSTVVRGVCGRALPLPRLPAHWAGCWSPSPTCCGRGRVGVGAHHCPLGLYALWGLRAAGVVGGRPRGGGLPPLRGASGVRRCSSPCRPSSGAGGRGPATRVSRVRSVRAWGPSTGSTVCALAGRLCSLWEWRKGVPGGGAFHRCEGRLWSGAPPPPTARPLGGLLGSATHMLWARVCQCGGPTVSPWPACPVGAACRGSGGGPSPGGLACHRCEGGPVSGAVPPPAAGPLGQAAGVPRPVCAGCVPCGRWDPAPAPQRAPLRAGVARCGGGGGASPGGGAFHCCEGRLWSGAPPPPTSRPLGGLLGSASHMPWARVCGCGSPTLSPWPACPVGVACRGGGGGPSPGGAACHRCEGRLVSGAVPPLAARSLGLAARVPRPVCPGCGWCGREDPAPAPRRAPLRSSVASRGGGGRASPGGVPSAVVWGAWGQALPLPRVPALWAGCRGPLPTCCGRQCAGVGALHRLRGPRSLWGAARHGGGGGRLGSGAPSLLLPALCAGCRGPLAACRGCGCGRVLCVWCPCGASCGAGCYPSPVPLVSPSLVLCCGVVLPVCLLCPLPCARPLLVCLLPPVSFVASSFFTLSSALCWLALLPGMHFFPASALVCVSVFPLACFHGPGSRALFFLSCWVP